MKAFEVSFRYQDRTKETEASTVKLDASSLPGAIAKATRTFVKGLVRKQRFDRNKNGLARLKPSVLEVVVRLTRPKQKREQVRSNAQCDGNLHPSSQGP